MEISSHILNYFIPKEKRTQVGIFDIVLLQKKIQKYHCIPLNKTGVCPQKCLLCKPTFIGIINRLGRLEKRDPYGAFVQFLGRERDIKISASKQEVGFWQVKYPFPGREGR